MKIKDESTFSYAVAAKDRSIDAEGRELPGVNHRVTVANYNDQQYSYMKIATVGTSPATKMALTSA